ncbi:Prolyl tripeptidyl peptidase precursor [Novipirellula aureliae]|uniref:Prolyl tripeptidyl peptidase n=1 Tax=Novipirellula aureliae TaxID=2527966 RepID=A0A5C6E9C8_9BACT|nr:DPP IV N-terminal domain-containing protein [Novipirellula aureliae]TWU45438.1 Prolyl tripeptidyl peptidase precursor [Novipirellula aureliae]
MNLKWIIPYLCMGTAITLLPGASDLQAQPAPESSWKKEAESRLKAIYDDGDYRGKSFQARWLADSSGYTIQETDPETNKRVTAKYDVRTAERTVVQRKDADRGNLVSPDGKSTLEFRHRDLFVRDLASGKRIQLTKHAAESDIRFNDPVWSPDGKHIAFVEADSTNVRQRAVLVPDDPSYPSVAYHRFARVAEKIVKLRVGVVDADGENLQWLPIESPPEGIYLGQVEWAGNSEEVLVEKLSRFRDVREFLLAKIDGDVKQIYHESDDAWAVGSQGKNSGLTWVQDGKAFIVVSEKDGWRHAFLCSRDGQDEMLLTPGEYDIIDRATVDENGGWYYFYASPENGTEKYLYRVPLDGSGKLERITPEGQPGTHQYDFSPDAKWAFHTYSTIDTPPIVELVELPEHRAVRVLEDNHELRDQMKQIAVHPTEFLQLDIADGISMDAWMIKPRDFDSSKKYPVFVYVYGEPYAQTVLNEWGTHHAAFHRLVADLGYLVVSIDNRGTPAPKGAAWRRSVYGSLGPLSTEEQAAGIKELGRTRPYVDLSRVGIWGWSGGGSNTLNALFRKPDVYHVGIAVVPKPQPHLYNAWFQEIYMRTRELNPDGYERAAAINFADGLKGNLLIVTGTGETNTHIQIIEGLVDRLIELGKPFDYMVYPNRDHGMREGVGTGVHLRMLIIRYLIDHLPPGPR